MTALIIKYSLEMIEMCLDVLTKLMLLTLRQFWFLFI